MQQYPVRALQETLVEFQAISASWFALRLYMLLH